MAYDKIITVRSRLDHCVDYVLNQAAWGSVPRSIGLHWPDR